MEAVGFAISIISLAGTFKDCIDLFSMISTAKSLEKDFTILSVKLDIERTLLLQWAEQVRLIHEDYDRRLDNPGTKRTIARVLTSIKDLLSDGSQLENRYGMQRLETNQPKPLMILSTNRLRRFRNNFAKLSLNDHTSVETVDDSLQSQGSSQPGADVNADPISQKHKTTIKEKFFWAIRDKEKFASLIQHLSELVRGLTEIVPPMQSASVHPLQQDVQQVERISRLELLMDVAKGHDQLDSLTNIIQAQIDQRCQQRILDSLWYRMLDHRKNSVSEAHPGTFDWALNPPTDDVEWDDLSSWLQSGSGIYWIHGKPGSGKTTLMKHLYDSSMTHSLLQEWAKDKPIVKPNFFFWQLGTPEQKTQYGLYRGLLYQIFTEDRSLIPCILPEMWREARNDNGFATQSSTEARTTSLDRSTEEELMLAFQRLRAHSQAAYCFFIDGLDEYSGDPFRLIEFLEKLVSSNIKAIVSSRPIPSCFQAFSRGHKLRLQDLTRHDIKTYVHDTIVLHKHTKTLVEMDSMIVDKIESELTERASGVFLWVVLACRSLIQGFAAFDSPQELQKRLNELPPELNDLFKHILQRIDPRYYEQAAKLLRVCYHSTDLRTDPRNSQNLHEALFTLGLALADADNLDITKPLQKNYLSQREKLIRCEILEARLRSRCCGLLEIRLGNFRRRTCFCQSYDLHSRDRCERPIVDSIVEFVHRTFFEFLKIDGIWENEYLQIRDEGFSPYAVLLRVNAHLMLVSFHRVLDDENGYHDNAAFEYISVTLRHLKYMDHDLGDRDTGLRSHMLLDALLETAEILRLLNCTKEVKVPWLSRLSDYLKLHFSTSKNGCLDLVTKLVCELGMGTTFQHMDISRYGDHTSPLLYHAIERPLVPKLVDNMSSSHSIISKLVANGCDVNEVIVDQLCSRETTPWITWLKQSPSEDYYLALEDSWVAEELLNGGADVSRAEDRFEEPIKVLVGRRILGSSLEKGNVDDEDGGFNESHPFFEDDLKNEAKLRLAYERVRRLLSDSARRREKFGADSVPTTSLGNGCGERNMLKRRCGESTQDDESEYSSASGSLQSKRQRICARLDMEMGTQELT